MRVRTEDPTISVLLQMLDHGFDVASWHGPNLGSALRGVDAGTALGRLPGRKCIWEQALHAAYWKQMVLNKVAGTTPFPGRGSNWPRLPETPTAAAWKADVQMLRDIHGRLRAAVAAMNPARLSDGKLRRMILGAALHDIYHAGQIRLIRKMLKS
jgi:hypothetical protein